MITGIVGMVIIVFFGTLLLSGDDNLEVTGMRPHLMVNDQLYWLSAHPTDRSFSEGNFIYIGEVGTEVYDTPKRNFQAYKIAEGTKVYYDSQLPHVVYLKTSASAAPYRYATVEASKDYLYHDETVYVSLSSCGWDYESYINNYIPIYGEQITVDKIPEDSIYIGDTRFVGYNMFVFDELETNAFQYPVSVYQDRNNSKLLYVGDSNMIYVAQL